MPSVSSGDGEIGKMAKGDVVVIDVASVWM